MSENHFDEAAGTFIGDRPDAKGLLVVFLNVGQLPPSRAEAFAERMLDRIRKPNATGPDLPADVGLLIVPVRPPQETKIEYIPFDGITPDQIDRLRQIDLTPILERPLEDSEELIECSGEPGCCAAYPAKPGFWGRVRRFVSFGAFRPLK